MLHCTFPCNKKKKFDCLFIVDPIRLVWRSLAHSLIIFVNSWEFTDKKSPARRNLNFSEEAPQMGPQIDNDFIFYWFYTCVTWSVRSHQYKYQHLRAGLSVVYRKQTPCDWQPIPFDE